jgi:hypothetical protein
MSLPPDVQFVDGAQLLVWRPRGILDQRKVDKIIAFVTEQENRFGKSFNRFTDISRLDSVDLNFNYVFHVALYRRLSRRDRTIIKSAFLVPNAEVSRYVRLHALLTDYSPLKVRIFKEYAVAAEWLGVPVALLKSSGATV